MSYYSEGDDGHDAPELSDMTWAVEAYALIFEALQELCCEIIRDLRLLMARACCEIWPRR